PPSSLGHQPEPAAQKYVQCAAVQEAPQTLLAENSAQPALALLRHRGRAALDADGDLAGFALLCLLRPGPVGMDDGSLLRATPEPDEPRASSCGGDAAHVDADPAAGCVLAAAWRDPLSRAVPVIVRTRGGKRCDEVARLYPD